MGKAKELAEQMFPEPQMENYDDILEYRNDRDWTFIARGAFAKGYEQAEQDLLEQAKIMNEIDKRKEAIQYEKELNPDAFTKEVSADNQALENAANAYVGHAPDIDEDSSVYSERLAFKAGAKWQKEYWDKVMRDNHVEMI